MYGSLFPDGRLQYCNAGHNPPLVVGPTEFRRLETGGPIVGLFEGATYEEESITLNVGDWLIIYSDGVSEALSADGEEYGEDRILACVRRDPSLHVALRRCLIPRTGPRSAIAGPPPTATAVAPPASLLKLARH